MEYCRTVGTCTDAVNHPERELSFRQVVTDTFGRDVGFSLQVLIVIVDEPRIVCN